MSGRDRETRDRLLRTAARLFAERGFRKVTVREICRAARANVAAVNYHFGDKLGLYREVLQLATDVLQATTDAARQAGEGCSADEKLRRFVHVHLRRMLGERDDWFPRLINREVADPTPGARHTGRAGASAASRIPGGNRCRNSRLSARAIRG